MPPGPRKRRHGSGRWSHTLDGHPTWRSGEGRPSAGPRGFGSRGPPRLRAHALPGRQLGAAGRRTRRPARARCARHRRRHVRADGSLRIRPRRGAQYSRHRSCLARPRGPLGHLCAHGYTALAQAPDGTRSRLSGAHLPRLVRGPARRRRLAAPLQGRHLGLARLPGVGARHRADCRRERRRGDADRARPGLRTRAVGATWRRRDGLRAQGRSRRRARWRGRSPTRHRFLR